MGMLLTISLTTPEQGKLAEWYQHNNMKNLFSHQETSQLQTDQYGNPSSDKGRNRRMSANYTAKQIAGAIESHQFTMENITLESVLSWPVPVKKGDQMFLAFFYYSEGGPIDDRKLGPPYYHVLADTESIENIQFTPVGPEDFPLSFPSDQPLWKHENDYLSGITISEYEVMAEQLYSLVDEMVRLYLKLPSEMSEREKDAVAQFHKLFHILAPKTKALLPYYIAMNPVFFHWVDEISAG
jgi:hypothetical protein